MTKKLDVTNPFNGSLVESIPLAGEAEIKQMIAKANAVKEQWGRTPLHKRSKFIYRFAELISENTEDIARTLSLEMGKPITQSRMETTGSANIARGFVERANHIYGENLCTDNQPGFENDVIFTMREPLGLIFCIIPFNYPVELFVHKVAPALAMGNVVIVKAPTKNPLAMLTLSKLFEQTGIPEGVVQSMVCDRDVAHDYLITNPEVQAVSLTGSTGAGIEMAKAGAETLKHLFLELGGNDPTIIMEDADLDYAVEEMVGGRIFNAGQTCCACKRFIVHQSVVEPLAEKLVARLKQVKIGDPLDDATDMGTLISAEAAKKVGEQIQYTVGQGAKLLCGGEVKGAVVNPAVITNVKKTMDVAIDLEIFGPVFPLIPFSTEEEALEIANATRYGLSAGIITKDTIRSMRMASKIKAGAVVVNGQSSYRHMEQAFGGYKMTGLGREGVSTTLEEHSQLKSFIIKGVFDK